MLRAELPSTLVHHATAYAPSFLQRSRIPDSTLNGRHASVIALDEIKSENRSALRFWQRIVAIAARPD
jgi:hypothetical protein